MKLEFFSNNMSAENISSGFNPSINNEPQVDPTAYLGQDLNQVPVINKSRRNFLILLGMAGLTAPMLACGFLDNGASQVQIPDDCWNAATGAERRAINAYIQNMLNK